MSRSSSILNPTIYLICLTEFVIRILCFIHFSVFLCHRFLDIAAFFGHPFVVSILVFSVFVYFFFCCSSWFFISCCIFHPPCLRPRIHLFAVYFHGCFLGRFVFLLLPFVHLGVFVCLLFLHRCSLCLFGLFQPLL